MHPHVVAGLSAPSVPFGLIGFIRSIGFVRSIGFLSFSVLCASRLLSCIYMIFCRLSLGSLSLLLYSPLHTHWISLISLSFVFYLAKYTQCTPSTVPLNLDDQSTLPYDDRLRIPIRFSSTVTKFLPFLSVGCC